MTQGTIGRWGKSLGVRIPADVARAVGLDAGTQVEILPANGGIVLKPIRKNLTIEDLFRGKSDAEWRAFYRDSAVDWGPDVGREIIDE